MGFPKTAVVSALKQTNNDLHRALEVMQEHPDLLTMMDTDERPWQGQVTDEMIAQVSNEHVRVRTFSRPVIYH